jgi:dolichol-phosphate mannosyltransferase
MNTQLEWIHGVYMTDILSGYWAFTLLSIRQMNLKKTGSETETGISSTVISRSLRFEIVPIFYKKRHEFPTKLHSFVTDTKYSVQSIGVAR